MRAKSVRLINVLCGLYRARSGMPRTDGEIADKLGISHTTMSQWTNGIRPPRQIEALLILCNSLPMQDVMQSLEEVLKPQHKENIS